MASGKKNYFRHSYFARNDDFVEGLIDEFGLAGYFYWFALLEICAEQCSDEPQEKFKFHESRLYRELRCNSRRLQPVLEYMQTSRKLVVNHTGKYYEIEIPNLSKYMGKYTNKNQPNLSNKRKEKKRKVNISKTKKNEYTGKLLTLFDDQELLQWIKETGSQKILDDLEKTYSQKLLKQEIEKAYFWKVENKKTRNAATYLKGWFDRCGEAKKESAKNETIEKIKKIENELLKQLGE